MAYGDYGRTTELEAVNTCLEAIGEQPVNSVPVTGVSKASLARDLIYKISRQVQNLGLNCNTEEDYELSPNQDNEIVLPNNCIDVDPDYLTDNRYVERNGKLYDREDHTYTITKSIRVTITFFLTWTELPEHVRSYITIMAARIFQARYLSDEGLHLFTEADEYAARSLFVKKELKNADVSILDNTRVNPRFYNGRTI
jgi:hypothetical protein